MIPVLSKELYPSTELTAAQTLVGEWVDVDRYTELIAWLNVTAFAAWADETLIVTIEREARNTLGYVPVLTFTTVASTGAKSEEKSATSLIGNRIRYRIVTAGTWTAKSVTFNIGLMAK